MSDGSIRDDALQEMAMTLRDELGEIETDLNMIRASLEELGGMTMPMRMQLELRILCALLSGRSAWEDGVWLGQVHATRQTVCILARLWADTFLGQLDAGDRPGRPGPEPGDAGV
jgi:hypothetical protein